jgi:hypothetical protein
LLIVTLCSAVARASPATKPVRPERAVGKAEHRDRALTACEVIFTIRPNLRAIMPAMVPFMSSIGASMLASSALIQSLRSQFRKSPGGGPPALLTRISGSGRTARMASRPSLVVTSAATATVSRRSLEIAYLKDTVLPTLARACEKIRLMLPA